MQKDDGSFLFNLKFKNDRLLLKEEIYVYDILKQKSHF